MYDTREHNRETIHKALQLISKMVGGGYRPQSLVAGYMDAENQKFLATEEDIHVCQGQDEAGTESTMVTVMGAFAIRITQVGSILKPAQGTADFIDCVCLDGWTCDFLAARRDGFQGGFNRQLQHGAVDRSEARRGTRPEGNAGHGRDAL